MDEPSVEGSVKSVPQTPDIVSIGLQVEKNTHLRKINQQDPLSQVLDEICRDFNLPDRNKYGLQFDNHISLGYAYITEENRGEIKDGSVCMLVYSPAHMVGTVLGKMVSPRAEENVWSFQKLLSFMEDSAFVEKFVESKGVTVLVTMLQGNALSYNSTGYAMKCLAELLVKGYVDNEKIKDRILDKVLYYILHNDSENTSTKTQESCLSIANTLMEKHASVFPEIYETLSLEKVIPYLYNESFWVQQTALSLINSIFTSSNALQRKLLIKNHAKFIKDAVYKKIIMHHPVMSVGMSRQLAIFQARFLSRLKRKSETPVDMEDNLVKRRMALLARLTLSKEDEADVASKRHTLIENTLTLLTDYVIPPPMSSGAAGRDSAPSILVLDCMTYFIKTHQQKYTKAVLEHSIKTVGQEYPFIELCSQLIDLLIEALGIRTASMDPGDYPYYPVLFCSDRIFEELFCASIMVFSKTCKEMRAGSEDFQKVMNVVKKKVQVSLTQNPRTLKDFEQHFYTKTYANIAAIWQEEFQEKEKKQIQENKSIIEMQQNMRPIFLELVKKHRLHALTRGAQFPKYSPKLSKIRNRFWFIKYIPIKKAFEFSDEEEKFNNFFLELSSIKSIVHSQNCPHVKLRGQKYKPEFGFSLILNQEPGWINLAADSQRQLYHVLDGFRMLLDMEMNSPACEEDVRTLTEMHVRIELLDAYGIDLPAGDPPPIPDDPPNYDFVKDPFDL